MNRPNWGRAIWLLVGLAVSAGVVVEAAFPDAHNPPPAGWMGPVFKLSQSYPPRRSSGSTPIAAKSCISGARTWC
jgi:hypothetical protein